jgi:DNA-binding transcriptional MerR regulator
MKNKYPGEEHQYGIGAVAKLTGLTDHTIRVWERRHSAVVTKRAENGRRIYGPKDVEKLNLLKLLTDRGFSIGQIAGESIDSLRDRTRNMAEVTSQPIPERITTGVLGDFLPLQLKNFSGDITPIEVMVSDNNAQTFSADLDQQDIDVIVLETPILDVSVINKLTQLQQQAKTSGIVIVYGFSRTHDVSIANDAGFVLVRSPVSIDELCEAITRVYKPRISPKEKSTPPEEITYIGPNFSDPAPPRRFTNHQLAKFAQVSSNIDCECPKHLTELVGDLTAFEVYSAKCANKDEDDALLHQYLHQTTAQARALIEIALERVAQAENLDY